jgi:hypothetical protein
VLGEGAAFLAELVDRHLVLVACPWRGIAPRSSIRSAGHGSPSPARNWNRCRASAERADDEILQDLVQRGADMDVAIGIGRAVMQDEQLACPAASRSLVQVHPCQRLRISGSFCGRPALHREFRLRQVSWNSRAFRTCRSFVLPSCPAKLPRAFNCHDLEKAPVARRQKVPDLRTASGHPEGRACNSYRRRKDGREKSHGRAFSGAGARNKAPNSPDIKA